MTIEVDDEKTREAMQRAGREIAKQVDIPGFRRGKAPYAAIVQRFGEDAVRRQAADLLADDVYSEALEQEQIEPYAQAELEDVKLDPITFKLTIPLRPIVDLGAYREYRLTPPVVELPGDAVSKTIESLRDEQAFFEPADRPAQLGDGVAFDLLAKTADGTEVLKGDDLRMVLDASSTDPVPGFHEALVGAKADEVRVFTLPLGDNYPREELRGQQAEFTVNVKQVYDYILPKLDDDLARTVGNFATFEELRQKIEEQLREMEKDRVEREYAEQALTALVEGAHTEFPPAMVKAELDTMVKEYERAVKREAKMSLEDYLRINNKTADGLREEMTPSAVERIKRGLALSELARLEGLELSDEEIRRGLEMVTAPYGSRGEQMRSALASSEDGRRAISGRLMGGKAVARLVEIAKGEAPALGEAPAAAEAPTAEVEAQPAPAEEAAAPEAA